MSEQVEIPIAIVAEDESIEPSPTRKKPPPHPKHWVTVVSHDMRLCAEMLHRALTPAQVAELVRELGGGR